MAEPRPHTTADGSSAATRSAERSEQPRQRTGPIAWCLILVVRGYQATLAPLMSGYCRFQPTCSNYAIEALRTHGAVRGTWLAMRRLLRCHPLGGIGYDPVPPARDTAREDSGGGSAEGVAADHDRTTARNC